MHSKLYTMNVFCNVHCVQSHWVGFLFVVSHFSTLFLWLFLFKWISSFAFDATLSFGYAEHVTHSDFRKRFSYGYEEICVFWFEISKWQNVARQPAPTCHVMSLRKLRRISFTLDAKRLKIACDGNFYGMPTIFRRPKSWHRAK